MITARHVFQKNMTFKATHSLFTTTNYIPVVSETDHGTWRRLALVKFPYTFRKPGQALQSDSDRAGDPTLKARVEHNTDSQHDAIVTWAVEGAMRWYADPPRRCNPPRRSRPTPGPGGPTPIASSGFGTSSSSPTATRASSPPTCWRRSTPGSGATAITSGLRSCSGLGSSSTPRRCDTESPRHALAILLACPGSDSRGRTLWGDLTSTKGSGSKPRLTGRNARVDRVDRPLRKIPPIRVAQKASKRVGPLGPAAPNRATSGPTATAAANRTPDASRMVGAV